MWLAEALFMLAGGVLAGAISLVVGGVGGMLQTQRMLRQLAGAVDDLHDRIDREVKTRAAHASVAARKGDPLVDQLAQAAHVAPGSTITTPAAILARGKQLGLVR